MPCVWNDEYNTCSGTMHRIGRLVTRTRTVSTRPTVDSVETQRERARRPGRGKRKADESFLKPDFDFGDEETAKAPGAKRLRQTSDDEDQDFVLALDFKPTLRLTLARMEAMRNFNGTPTGTPQTTGRVAVANSIAGERFKSTKDCFDGWPAWKYARAAAAPNAGIYTIDKRNHYEWCHLQGVALGGLTLASNLVAGHYALNTWMMTIESVVGGKSGLEIEVIAWCVTPNIADSITYRIYRANGKLIADLWADGHITKFSRIDYDALLLSLSLYGL